MNTESVWKFAKYLYQNQNKYPVEAWFKVNWMHKDEKVNNKFKLNYLKKNVYYSNKVILG